MSNTLVANEEERPLLSVTGIFSDLLMLLVFIDSQALHCSTLYFPNRERLFFSDLFKRALGTEPRVVLFYV